MLAMECSQAANLENCKLPPTPPQRKYVSMFHIDGVPILPPLMTTERRRKMRKLKQKAIEVEQQLAENHRRKLQFVDEANIWKVQQSTPEQMPKKAASQGDDCHSARSNKSSISQNSAYDLHADDSYLLLSSLMQSNEESKKYANSGTCTNNAMNTVERNIEERMQKLQKSETLIYDNRSNTIIMPISNLEQTAAEQKVQRRLEASRQNGVFAQKCDYRLLIKPQIPSICVNPPTPLTGTRNFSDALSTSEDEAKKNIQAQYASADEFSTDESVNTSQSSPLSAKYTSANITPKILKIESLQNEQNNTSQTPRKSLEPACTKPPQRSATSPLLKPTLSTAQNKHLLKNSVSAVTTDSNQIVRSNSFTLDTPSKALLEHLRQQKTAAATSSPAQHNQQQSFITKRNSPLNNFGSRSSVPSASATRDTVESKAKRVQKVELKSRTAQMAFTTKCSSASGGYTLGNKSSNTLLNKSINKPRSPYEFKSAATKMKLGRSNTNKMQTNTPTTLLAKSLKSPAIASKSNHNNCFISSSTNHAINNNNNNNSSNDNINTSNNNSSNNNSNSHSSNNNARSAAKVAQSGILNEIEAEHRQKFAQLIAQQHEEQKRLQLAFEVQQKILIEQLSSGIDKVQLTPASPRRSSNESSPTKSSSCALNSDRSGSILNTTKSPTLSLISSSALSHSVCDLTRLEDTSCAASSINTYTSNNSGRTPRRRLFDQASSTSSINTAQNSTISNLSTNRRLQYQLENERRTAAATVICAYARGFLTRRLFQTEQIQRIVQTIRDTLIFVLNLHIETMENLAEANTSANIKLKARLLQQLSSASRTLYLMLFQTTVQERMEIIARDRKRIKTKLLSLNLKRSPRIVA